MKFCMSCGKQIGDHDRKCASCGHAIYTSNRKPVNWAPVIFGVLTILAVIAIVSFVRRTIHAMNMAYPLSPALVHYADGDTWTYKIQGEYGPAGLETVFDDTAVETITGGQPTNGGTEFYDKTTITDENGKQVSTIWTHKWQDNDTGNVYLVGDSQGENGAERTVSASDMLVVPGSWTAPYQFHEDITFNDGSGVTTDFNVLNTKTIRVQAGKFWGYRCRQSFMSDGPHLPGTTGTTVTSCYVPEIGNVADKTEDGVNEITEYDADIHYELVSAVVGGRHYE